MRCCTKRKPREEEEAMGYWFIYSPNRWRDHGKEKLNGQVLKEIDHPIMYSLSPGVGATPAMAKDVSPLVNMYRVTGDDWDSWSDVASHFNVSRPLSYLDFGGDMRKLDDATYNIIRNPTLLEINTFSRHNMEFPYITGENETVTTSTSSKEMNASDSHVLGLTCCKDPRVKGWVSEVLDNELEKICWKDNIGRKQSLPFCLYKSKHLLKS
ncbi:hypothetical protein IFM89_034489 [Coptis chinensis]|uniref:Uncharacterized protein n=1 Tax=Coptis chinensis TaxID=261450 RepID=A0A835H8E9_9MAGN|nr:hypothetical protein IFM89_034489 [Coptis chinensis]